MHWNAAWFLARQMLRNEIFEAHLFCTVTFGGPSLTWSTATHYRAKQNYTLSTGAQVFQCLTSKFMSLATRTSNRLDWDTVERLIALPIELFARNAGKPCARVFNEFKSAKRSLKQSTPVCQSSVSFRPVVRNWGLWLQPQQTKRLKFYFDTCSCLHFTV